MRRLLKLVAAVAGLLVFAAALAAGAFAYAAYGWKALPVAEASLVVPDGSTGSEVANLLAERKIVPSAFVFRVLQRLQGAAGTAKSGEYRFAAHLTSAEVLRRIASGGAQVAIWVTLPEGFTAREIAQRLAERGLGEEPALEAYFLNTPFEPAPGVRAPSLEGYLFPDTYLFPLQSNPAALARIMTDRFRAVLPPDALARARRLGYSLPQIVTIASMIEREAQADDERRLMAGVYYNRLKLGMPLQVDATLEYTFAHHKTEITRADLARDTPYNTYLHDGLPPTPIASPGKASLLAALDPQPSDFLYYVYKGNGHHAFSRTLAEHNANVARYLK
jgi:UPF0755 protein